MKKTQTFFLLLLLAQTLTGQVLATWDFENSSVVGTAGIPQATPASATVVRASNAGVQQIPGGGLGLTGLGWPASATLPGYFQAEVICPAGDCDLQGISFVIQAGPGAPQQIRVEYSLSTNFGNPVVVGTYPLTANVSESFNLPLFSPNVSRVGVRIFGLATASAPFAALYLDGLSINGTISLTPLPLEWTGIAIDDLGDVARIRWSTASETDLSHFQVEVAYGDEAFAPIAKVDPVNAVQGRRDYSYMLSKQAAQLYVRIRAIDLDGSENLSDVVTLKGDPRDPNVRLLMLSQNTAQLVAAGNTPANIVDSQGRFLRKLTLLEQTPTLIDLSDMPSGLYYIVSPNQTLRLPVIR